MAYKISINKGNLNFLKTKLSELPGSYRYWLIAIEIQGDRKKMFRKKTFRL